MTKEYVEKWRRLESFFQYSTLASLVITVWVLSFMSKQMAKDTVLYFAALIIILASISYFAGMKFRRSWRTYWHEKEEGYKKIGV